jgi:ABC-type Na+ efflux pump permease subunit
MDQDERAEGAAMSTAAKSDDTQEPRSQEEIRADIEQSRETDVKAQARDRIEELKGTVRAKADQAKAKAQSSTPESAQQGGQQLATKARENRTPLVIGGAVLLAFLLGRRTGRP